MRDVKVGGDQNWPHAGYIRLDGDPEAQSYQAAEGDAIIRSWKVAVLRVRPANAKFTLLFISGDNAQYLRPRHTPYLAPWQRQGVITQDGLFGVSVGLEDVAFLGISLDLKSSLQLDFIALIHRNDPAYANLPVN